MESTELQMRYVLMRIDLHISFEELSLISTCNRRLQIVLKERSHQPNLSQNHRVVQVGRHLKWPSGPRSPWEGERRGYLASYLDTACRPPVMGTLPYLWSCSSNCSHGKKCLSYVDKLVPVALCLPCMALCVVKREAVSSSWLLLSTGMRVFLVFLSFPFSREKRLASFTLSS